MFRLPVVTRCGSAIDSIALLCPPARSPQPRSQGGTILGILGAGRQALETGGYCAEVGLTPVLVNTGIIVRRLLRDAWKRYRWGTRARRCA